MTNKKGRYMNLSKTLHGVQNNNNRSELKVVTGRTFKDSIIRLVVVGEWWFLVLYINNR